MTYLPPALLLAVLLIPVAGFSSTAVQADPGTTATANTSPGNWQLRRLMEPTESELVREAQGEVVIYDRLTDKQVDAAMSAHPERIRSMMFLGTIITDEQGEAKVDETGMFAMEDDGC